MRISDDFLVDNLRKGEVKAFDQLYRQYYKGLCHFGYRYIKDMEVVQEIVQDIFLKIWENREQLKPLVSFKSYIFTAMRNGCIDYIRKENVRNRYENELAQAKKVEVEPDKIPDKQVMDQIKRAIDKLPKQRRRIFRMNRFLGLRYKEIAVRLNLSPKTVENQMGLALKQLRDMLGDVVPILFIFACLGELVALNV